MDAPSDLIVDVAKAADPQRAEAMVQRLQALGGAANPEAFTQALSSVAPPSAGPRIAAVEPAPSDDVRAARAREKFEATMLNSFVNEMMPRDTSSAYGGGYAGDMWRSLLAEKVSDSIAKSGRLGLAERIFGSGHSPALSKLEHAAEASGADRDVTATSANALSLPAVESASNGSYLFVRKST